MSTLVQKVSTGTVEESSVTVYRKITPLSTFKIKPKKLENTNLGRKGPRRSLSLRIFRCVGVQTAVGMYGKLADISVQF